MNIVLSKPFNLVAFNLMWLGCVVGRESLLWLVGPLVVSYAALLIISGRVRLYQIAIPVLIGIGADAALTTAGIFHFENSSLLIPLWLMILWIAFATTLTQSLQLIGKNKLVATLAGAVAVPFNYTIGERLGAVSFQGDYVTAVVVLSIIWAALLPTLFSLVESTRTNLYEPN